MPAGPLTFTVQLTGYLTVPITAGNPAAGIQCGNTTTLVATPALWINY